MSTAQPKLTSIGLPVLPPATARRITPTDVSQFVRLEQCERFLRLRLAEPKFVARVRKARAETVERAAALLTAASAEAVRTLLALQKDGVKSAVRLAAAKAILDLGVKLRELVELTEEVEQLRERMKEIEAGMKDARREIGTLGGGY